MKSIKPGRGPSGMSAIASAAVVLFGLFWTGMAVMITRGTGGIGIIFPLFGVVFIIIGIAQTAYHLKNARGEERFSIIDIVDKEEEGDPSDRWIRNEIASGGSEEPEDMDGSGFNYCPYCGVRLESGYMYCPKCGKSVEK